jgi:hypothetical protein
VKFGFPADEPMTEVELRKIVQRVIKKQQHGWELHDLAREVMRKIPANRRDDALELALRHLVQNVLSGDQPYPFEWEQS